MSSFIKEYLDYLKNSDEKTKHKSSVFISIVFSFIILIILFFIFKNSVFNFSAISQKSANLAQSRDVKTNTDTSSNVKDNNENEIASPFTSISNFIKDSKEQISKIKSEVSSLNDKN